MFIPLSVEEIVVVIWFVPIPLSVEEVVLWVCGYPSLCRGCVVGERSCVLLICITKFSVEVPYVGGPVWKYSGNPSV